MQVPIQPYYTISGLVLLQQYENNSSVANKQTRLNILLDMPVSQLPGLFALLDKMKNNFLFSLPASVANDPDRLKALAPPCYLLASTHQYAVQEMPLIPILRNDAAQPAEFNTGILEDYFYKQGTENLQLPVFEYNHHQQAIQQSGTCSFYTYDAAAGDTIQPFDTFLVIIGFASIIKDLADFNHCIRQTDSFIKVEIPAGHFIEKQIFDREMQHWQKRALLYRHFIQLSKSVQEKEYYEVLDWYRSEYEVLPLWYKRFGHIIKVLMGKRSFRSLFSDNVKKYKD